MTINRFSKLRAITHIVVAAICTLVICVGCSSANETEAVANSEDTHLEAQADGQETKTSGSTSSWERIKIPNVGTMSIPPDMEVQDASYKAMKEELVGESSDTFIIQQRGLNEGSAEAQDTYARILVSYDQGEPGDYPERDYDVDAYSSADVAELDSYFEQEMRAQLERNGIGVIEWYPLEFTSLNGTPCLHMSYSRVGDAGETTQVDVYGIPCNDRFVRVTLSYRVSDADMWADDLDLALHSIEFE